MKTYKFCPVCAGELKRVKEELFVCSQCDYNYYINPKPCNAIILENPEKKILLVKRKYPPQEGMWDLPGGFISVNESAEQSVIREVEEELGVTISNPSYFASGFDTYEYQGVLHATLGFLFTGKIGDETINPQDDISDYGFFSYLEIPYDEIAFSSVKHALKKYIQDKNQ